MIEWSLIITILILCGLNVFQFRYWSLQVQILVDKLMSRSYFEYASAQKQSTSQTKPIEPNPPHPGELEDLRVLEGIDL